MADRVTFKGALATVPATGSPSGHVTVGIDFDDVSVLTKLVPLLPYTLTSDSPQSVGFGPLAEAAWVAVRVVSGGVVEVRLTSGRGTLQVVPVDEFLILKSRRAPFTAMTLTRDAGVQTVVEVLLGQMS